MRRSLTVLGIGLVLGVSGGIGVATTSEPPPASTNPSIARVVPDSGSDLTATITSLQDTLRRLPKDHVSWANLSLAYVEQARITGLASYYEKADEAAARSLSIEPDENFPALGARGAIAAARHDFAAALADADRALAINPRDLTALAVRIDALTELGRYTEQLRAVRAADRLRPSTTIAARYAYAYELRGDLDLSGDVLQRAAESGSLADKAYPLTLRADILRKQGRLQAAGRDLATVRQVLPTYLPALISSARLKTARGDLEGAVATWQSVVAQQPLPEYLTELGELLQYLGRTDEAKAQFAVVRTTIELLNANGVGTDLETALFEADHGSAKRALTQARAEWDRRTSVHVADALAWALHRTGRDAEALPITRAATRLGTPEARFWIHRGTIEAALGMTAEARMHLKRGLATDPGMSPLQRAEARAVLRSLEARR
ncbi:MAG: Tetratricopeptide repeat-containing protein [Nocardioides sp.]|jgi:tetratricopeptide (TPR) repeat protein|uniref:tetratricopeptide repeat protein n=1 Tax=Nocardioides sp. TaxID=35761 RepID=UPI00262BB777|nr:tetratricopeptide repeat protein [Nocardioides sp.]MCW2835162.1 Tetratricopeptide repeat-containing protein [Nocardioides sp.]